MNPAMAVSVWHGTVWGRCVWGGRVWGGRLARHPLMPCFRIAPVLSGEGHEPKPEHVERGDKRGHDPDQPVCPARLVRAPQDFILAEEAGQWRDSRDRE